MPNFWKIAPGEGANHWQMCHQKGCILLGWLELIDYSKFTDKDEILKALGGEQGAGKGAARSIWSFAQEIQPSDVVIANKGTSSVVGIGVVRSEYLPPKSPKNPGQSKWLPHARLVDWLVDQPIDFDHRIFALSTVHLVKPETCDEIKQAYLKKYPELKDKLDQLFPSEPDEDGVLETEKMKALLEQFRQIIVYGPPGTGKTREATRVALTLLSGTEPAAEATAQEIEQKLKPFREANRFDLVVFHPAYEYEQFVGGIEPTLRGGQLIFQAKAGAFLRLCRAAEKHQQPAVLVIDEINRGNLPKLLGELVYALEYRNHEVRLPFDDGRTDLIVPKNLHVIATMNSADRSIGHIDVAIRRRFGLYHLPPNPAVVMDVWNRVGDTAYGMQLANLMKRLNARLATGNDPSAEAELGVGHSYFLPAPGSSGDAAKQQVRMKWDYQVRPLLREYAQLLNLGTDNQAFFKKSLDQALTQS